MKRCALVLGALLVVVTTGICSPVSAQDPARAQPAPTQRADDVVILKGGGMLRGTITEMLPRDSVTIVLVTGESRKVSIGQVEYAGPLANIPRQQAPEPGYGPPQETRPRAREVPVRLHADKAGVTFFWRGDTAVSSAGEQTGGMAQSYRRICVAPCEATLPAGGYLMALSSGHSQPADVDDVVNITEPSTLQGAHTSYKPLRIFGTVLAIGAVVGGLYLAITSFHKVTNCNAAGCSDDMETDTNRLIAGVVVLVGGAVVGGILQNKSDSANIRVIPGLAAGLATRRATASGLPAADVGGSRASQSLVPGFTLSYSF